MLYLMQGVAAQTEKLACLNLKGSLVPRDEATWKAAFSLVMSASGKPEYEVSDAACFHILAFTRVLRNLIERKGIKILAELRDVFPGICIRASDDDSQVEESRAGRGWGTDRNVAGGCVSH